MAFENGVFNFAAYGASEIAIVSILALFFILIVSLIVALVVTVKRYKKYKRQRKEFQRSAPIAITRSDEKEPFIRATGQTRAQPSVPHRVSQEYAEIPLPFAQSSDYSSFGTQDRPLPRLPPSEESYGVLPRQGARKLPPKPLPTLPSSVPTYGLAPRRINRSQYQPLG